MASYTAMVLFVLGTVYTLMFYLGLQNTGKRLFKFWSEKNSIYMKIFTAFYICVLLQISVTCLLYWIYFGQFLSNPDNSNIVTSAVALIFLPTILMTISYSLLYYQYEK